MKLKQIYQNLYDLLDIYLKHEIISYGVCSICHKEIEGWTNVLDFDNYKKRYVCLDCCIACEDDIKATLNKNINDKQLALNLKEKK